MQAIAGLRVLPHQGIETMKTQGRFLFGTMAVAALMMGSLPAFAQWEGYPTPGIPRLPDGKPNLSAPLPRTPEGKPDLSGIWQSTRGAFNIAVGLKPGESVPFNAAGKKIFDERRDNNSKDDPSARCQPTGIPVRNQLNTPMKIIQIPGVTVFLYESRTTYRQILTDGRPLPKVDWPAWAGFSIGRWEGDTFVVETAGFNGRAWLDTIDDPNVYSRPWTIYGQFVLKADTELLEFICEENERDSQFMVGK
jgi:hypothetical protein